MRHSRNTQTGAKFEKLTDMQAMLSTNGYTIEGNSAVKRKHELYFYPKHDLYKWLKNTHNINWTTRISSQLLPDDAIYNPLTQTLTIVEKKFQENNGSADEKLQTATFKKGRYEKLFEGTGITIRFCFLLSDWFKQPKYVDVLEYVEAEGHNYFFNTIPPVFLK